MILNIEMLILKNPLTRIIMHRSVPLIKFHFCKNFLKQTSTEFQKELGLVDKLQKIMKDAQSEQKITQRVYGIPFVVGIAAVVMLFLGWDQEFRKNVRYSSGVILSLMASNLCSAKVCQQWVLGSIYKYTINVRSYNSPTFLYQMQHYIRRNGVKSIDDSTKIGSILEYSCQIIQNPPQTKYLESIERILKMCFFISLIRQSKGVNQISKLLFTFGDIQQQYLALLVSPNIQISQRGVIRFNQNMKTFKNMKDITTSSYVYKSTLMKNHILFILQKMKQNNFNKIEIPLELKELYNS